MLHATHPKPGVRLGPFCNPVRGLLHGGAAAFFLGFAAWILATDRLAGSERLLLSILAGSQWALFTASALYHSLPWSPPWKRRMQRVDHSMIYVKIAGTVTPVAWLGLDGGERFAVLGAAWGIAAAGVFQKLCFTELPERASVPLQALQGALAVPALVGLSARAPEPLPGLMLAAAVFYGVGVAVFLTGRPRLWPRIFSSHELFHLLVVAGSGVHTTVMWKLLARL